jgi:hypothetical protein
MSNPNNPVHGEPSTQMEVMNWDDAQARSANNSTEATIAYNTAVAALPGGKWPLGGGSITPGSFVTNGKEPNTGNMP